MAEPLVSFIIANDEAFQDVLDKLAKQTSDFRIPFGLIANHFYRGNRKIFKLKGTGLYQDFGGFSPNAPARFQGETMTRRNAYRLRKIREVGFDYPMLVKDGELAASLVGPNNQGSELFIGRGELTMGTSVPHAIYHQSDKPRKKIPQRKVVFIDGGPAETAKDASISGRREAWTKIIIDYERQLITGSAI